MAFLQCNIHSNALEMETVINVILPHDRAPKSFARPFKVLYLHHGYSDNASAWVRNTSVERYSWLYNVAVVMPEVQHSFGVDMDSGMKYFKYVSEELPNLCTDMFNISKKREDTLVAGLSMGGYVALKCAISHPERFSCCASFSGVTDVVSRIGALDSAEWRKEKAAIFGMEKQITLENDVHLLTKKLAKESLKKGSKIKLPKILLTCGKDDFLYQDNLTYCDLMANLPYDFKFMDWEGCHNWDFWDESIKIMMKYFLDNKKRVKKNV